MQKPEVEKTAGFFVRFVPSKICVNEYFLRAEFKILVNFGFFSSFL